MNRVIVLDLNIIFRYTVYVCVGNERYSNAWLKFLMLYIFINHLHGVEWLNMVLGEQREYIISNLNLIL